MNDKFLVGFVWFFMGIIFCILINSLSSSLLEKAKTAIENCEMHLPRDQHCKLIAVPEILWKMPEAK